MKQRRKILDAKITIIGGKYFRCHVVNKPVMLNYDYRKVASSNTFCLEAHAGFFRLLIKGIFDPNVLWPFDKKLIS